MKEPIGVSEATYQSIEEELESHWDSLPWQRIVKDGKRGGYDEVTSRFDLVCEARGDDVIVSLVSKESPDHKPFVRAYRRYM